jgi:NAD(P)-dependent dehydrogenase (short-subunit alcohol dehydrogenase family)
MLTGKTVLVTGSSSGIGLGAARAVLDAGGRVALTSERPLADCPDVQATLAEFPAAVYLQADLSRDDAAEPLVAAVWDRLGGVDVLVNNVGTFREPDFLSLTRADFDRTFHLNVWPAVAVTQAVVRRAAAAGRGGRVLFTSSLNGRRSEPGHTLYDASKGAVDALVRQLAVELAPLGWTTAAIAPGLVETPITDMGLRSDPAARRQVEEQIPVRRIATVADVAGWFAFLASDAASYATGVVIPVCGGLDAQQMPTRPLTAAERGG